MKILSTVIIPGIAGEAQWVRMSNIKKGLEAYGHEVDLIHYFIKRNPFVNYKSDFVHYYENNYGVKSTRVCNPFSLFFMYLKDLLSNEYDIIYGNTTLGAFIPIFFKKLRNCPVILDMHGLTLEEFKLSGSKSLLSILFCKLLEYVSLNFSDKIVCVSKSMIRYLHLKRNIPLDKLVYVTNGVDLDFFKQVDKDKVDNLKRELNIENKFVFGYIGGFQKWQGLDNYIEAIKLVNDKNAVFLFVGGENKITATNTISIPWIPREKVISYYSICDVLVLPRPNNLVAEVAAPTKFAEYISMGKPILATKVGDAGEFLSQYKNGILVENDSVKNISEGIFKFLTIDKGKLSEMGKNSRKLAEEEFNWDTISKNLKNIFIDKVNSNEN